jgi:hypothetical protein
MLVRIQRAMPREKEKFKVTYGGWYQRTTLHMSEVYNLFAHGTSDLKLSPEEVKKFQEALSLKSVSRESGYLEYVKALTADGIEIRYYEDGLYILETEGEDIYMAEKALEAYFKHKFNPAVSYIFSLGAPTPKVLANIKTTHPIVVSIIGSDASEFVPDESYGEAYTKVSSKNFSVTKTPHYIFIKASKEKSGSLRDIVEMQIFFREFKDQLEKYLSIHRTIWEEISAIKEGKTLRGSDVEAVRGRLDGYQKTISLISNRINQMGSYNNTRSSITKHLEIEEELIAVLEYKFETLTDTLSYIKEVWKMTSDYLASAIGNLVEIKSQSTSNNLKSLQTITSIGVISGVLGYLSANTLPRVSRSGAIYFLLLFALTWGMNYAMGKASKNKQYSLKFGDRASDL